MTTSRREPWQVSWPAMRSLATLLLLAMMAVALPGKSRLGASGAAAWRVARHGGGAWKLAAAVLQPREFSPYAGAGSPSSGGNAWEGMEANALRPPAPDVSPHESALRRAVDQGWIRCGESPDACAKAFTHARASLPVEQALEAVVLGDPDGTRVKAAVAAADSAGVECAAEFSAHAPFLADTDKARAEQVERVLGLATLWGLQWPMPVGTRITSPYGERTHPVTGKKSVHEGVDLAAVDGTPLSSPARARVLHVGEDSISGRYVVLDHGHQVQSVSCHLSIAEVKRGQDVTVGALYARTGATGRVTGPHLHYGVRLGGKFVDPVSASLRVP